jgi:hypothetical protein
MTVQQLKIRFNMHPHGAPGPHEGVQPPAPERSLPGVDGPIPVPPGGLVIDPSFFDMPDFQA